MISSPYTRSLSFKWIIGRDPLSAVEAIDARQVPDRSRYLRLLADGQATSRRQWMKMGYPQPELRASTRSFVF
jgi:hypothetical protein